MDLRMGKKCSLAKRHLEVCMIKWTLSSLMRALLMHLALRMSIKLFMNEVSGNKQIEGSAIKEVNTRDGEIEDEVIQNCSKR